MCFYLVVAIIVTGLLIYCNRAGYVRSLSYIILGVNFMVIVSYGLDYMPQWPV